ncbi:DUF2497 domain-containing protein [Hyphomicrobium sp. 802]|uniref:DUF2497 domain-containing protein n=1 Tax=Hyphomicrobium sp. 802 TaxID=1112272 RepID=UPI00045EA6B7|nr:DUF2497 domain-containing protein [Hyphomicrobium sp. 802]
MSRLESNAEPSMEEILASIRKIIAEDSSGLRAPSAAPKPGTPYSPTPKSASPQPTQAPAPTPQRGFMSREAFLKSPPSSEPETRKDTDAPFGGPRSAAAERADLSPSSRLRPRDEPSPFDRVSPSIRDRDAAPTREPFRARGDERSTESAPTNEFKAEPQSPASSQPSISRSETLSIDAQIAAARSVTIETVEVVPVEEALPIVKEDSPAILKVEPEPAAAKSVSKTDTASIEAQLTELLSEDLNALRQSRAKAQADETAVKLGEPKIEAEETAPTEAAKDTASKPEASDPFAFDLGPSPFAPKPASPHQKIETQEASAPTPKTTSAPAAEAEPTAAAKPTPSPQASAPAEPAPLPKFEPIAPAPQQLRTSEPAAEEEPRPAPRVTSPEPKPVEANNPFGSAPYFGPFGPQSASPAEKAVSPAAMTASPIAAVPPKSEPEAPAPRGRPTFAVPSVSATLGPSRKLEPLANAFQPAPPPPPSVMETFAPAAESAPERRSSTAQQSAPEPPWAAIAARTVSSEPPSSSATPTADDKRDETVLHSTLPATTSETALDRQMEDAVADLLRPLLKTWLAENMPKIVERALRREMSERLLPGQKNPRD